MNEISQEGVFKKESKGSIPTLLNKIKEITFVQRPCQFVKK